jgi:haloalkane dehalogenase
MSALLASTDRSSVSAAETPDWVDREAFPFESQFRHLDAGRVHYVDEGDPDAPPVLMLHGNPTWSFLYRHVIRELADDYRCLALDYLGFGLSDKPLDFSYEPADHARVVTDFVEALGLEDLTLVVQDWGGPIGLDYATRYPTNVRALVVLNTWLWPVEDDRSMRLFSRVLGSRVGRLLIRRFNLFARWVMPAAYADRSRLTPDVHEQYLRPLSTPADREASWVFPRELLGSEVWLDSLWHRRDAIADKPALFAFGMQDAAFAGTLPRWRGLFPDARVVEYDDAGHYLQEEKGPELGREIRAFLDGLS